MDSAVSQAHLATGVRTYGGPFLVTLATLLHEILLTRVFGVTMWYHYAFMALSLALLGMAAGAIVVYVLPGAFPRERTHRHLALSALLFGVTSVAALWSHLVMPVDASRPQAALVFTYLIIAVPFACSGVCVSLAPTRFPRHVSRLYAADLAGAACGGLLFVFPLHIIDAPGAAFAVAALGCAGAALFASREAGRAPAVDRRLRLPGRRGAGRHAVILAHRGMKTAAGRFDALTPWFWGVNGATSVCASVLAMAIALNSGISAAFWTGVACYVVASAAYVVANRETVAGLSRAARAVRPDSPLARPS